MWIIYRGGPRCPKLATIADLVYQVNNSFLEVETIYLYFNSKECTRKGKLLQEMNKVGMSEALSSKHPNLASTNTWFIGK